MNWYILAFLTALAISFLATPWVRRIALRLNVMAPPGGRRVHAHPMPLWGGIAIYSGFAIACLVAGKLGGGSGLGLKGSVAGILISGALILTMGLLDDMRELSAAIQVAAIACAAVVLITFDVRVKSLSNPFGDPPTIPLVPVVSGLVTLVWVFAVTKTVDFMDGLDGLAAGIGAIAAGVLAIMAFYAPVPQPEVALMSAALSGACIGFLRFNFNPAKIFMGTGGSQFVGFALAAIAIVGLFKAAAALAIALPVLVLGVPLLDGFFVVVRRIVNRRPIHIADRTHLHHRLLERGLSHKEAVIVIYAICLVLAGTALTLWFSR